MNPEMMQRIEAPWLKHAARRERRSYAGIPIGKDFPIYAPHRYQGSKRGKVNLAARAVYVLKGDNWQGKGMPAKMVAGLAANMARDMLRALPRQWRTNCYVLPAPQKDSVRDGAGMLAAALAAHMGQPGNGSPAPASYQGRRVLLVDDTMYSGETLRAMAADCYARGAVDVAAVIYAKP